MVPHASRPSMSALADVRPEPMGFATCPSCHTADPVMTNLAVSGGADWRCGRCGQRWDAIRLAAVAAYAVWLAEYSGRVGDHATTVRR